MERWNGTKSKPEATGSFKAAKRRRALGFMPLEPRILYDGAAAATVASAHHHHHDTGTASTGQIAGAADDHAHHDGGAIPSNVTAAGTSVASSDNGHSHATEPMPTVVTWVKDPTEIVFIDTQAPDYQLLAAGVKPGIEVVELNANSDGLQQIADFLSRHPDPNLTTIDIVGHGQDGMLFLGNAVLDNDTVGQYTTQLATIGSALQPGGDLMLYGCDVAATSDGIILLAQITEATGVNVAASTGLVGSAAEGGSWALDAASGVIDATVPFTAATLAAYPDVLNADVFGIIDGSSGDGIVYGTDTGSGQIPGTEETTSSTPSGIPEQIQLDTQDGLYFVLLEGNSSSPENEIQEYSLSAALSGSPQLLGTLETVAYASNSNAALNDIQINSFQVDVADNVIFFNEVSNANNGLTVGHTDNIDVITFSSAHFSGTSTLKTIGTTTQYLEDMVVDPADMKAYFYYAHFTQYTVGPHGKTSGGPTDSGGHGGPTIPASKPNGTGQQQITTTQQSLFMASWSGSNTNPTSFALTQLPISGTSGASLNDVPSTDGTIQELALDTKTDVLYFDTNQSSGTEGIYSYALTGNASGTIGTVWTQTSAVQGALSNLTIDAQTGEYYVSVDDGTTVNGNAIYEGSLSGGAPTKFISVNTTTGTESLTPVGLAIDNAPQLTTSGAAVTYAAGSSGVDIDHGISLSDSDNTDLAGATVSITAHFQAGDVLGIPSGDLSGNVILGTNITESYNAATGVLTLSGVDTLVHYRTALDEVTFSSTLVSPSTTARTITFSVSDGLLSGSGTDTVNIHDAPVVTAGATTTFNGGGSAVLLDGGLTLTDVSSTTLASATISIGSGFVSGDTLTFTNTGSDGNIVGSYANGVLSLSSAGDTATLAQWTAALESVTYSFSPSNGNPTSASRTIDWVVNDGTLNSTVVTSTLNTVHTAPTVTPSGAIATFDGGGAAVVLDSGITLNDVDSSGNLTGATVTIGSANLLSGDTLNFVAQNGISEVSFAAGVLTLTGTATVAQYQAALRSITYSFTPGGDPTNGGGDTVRAISWTVTDGSSSNGTSTAQTSTLDTVHVAPAVTPSGNAATFDVGGAAVALDSGLVLSDPDSGGKLSQATISIAAGFVSGSDTLNFTAQNGITETSFTGGVLTLTGSANTTLAQWQTALDSITFSTTATTAISRTIDWSVTDGSSTHGTSAVATSTVQVIAGPQISGTGTTAEFYQNGAAVLVDSGLVLTDPAGANISSATVTIKDAGSFVLGDILSANTSGTSITASYNSTTGVLTLSGNDTAAHYQSVLDSITYGFNPANGDPTVGGTEHARSVTYSVTDANAVTGAAGSSSTVDTFGLPVVMAGASASFTEGGGAVTLDNPISVTDPNAQSVSDPNGLTNFSSATVSISGGFVAGDTLNVAESLASTGITATYDSTDGVLTLSGASSFTNYIAALDSITFSTSASVPFGTTPSRTISWTVDDNAGGQTNPSAAATSSVTLLHADHAPVLSGTGNTVLATEQTPIVLDGSATVSDAELDSLNGGAGDYAGASLTIVNSGGANTQDSFGFNSSGATFTVSGGNLQAGGQTFATFTNSNGTLTIDFTSTGTAATSALVNTVLQNITYTNQSFTPPASVVLNWSFNDGNTGAQGAGGGKTATGTTTADITAVDNAPVATISAASFDAVQNAALSLANDLSVSDVDGGNGIETATLSVGEGTLSVAAGTSGVASISGSGSSLVTINGTVAEINALLNGSGTVSFIDTNASPAASTVLTLSINDNGNTGTGGPLTSTATATIDVHALPVVMAGASATFEIGGNTPVALDPGLTVNDSNHSTDLTSAMISIASPVAGDTLSFSNTSATNFGDIASATSSNGQLVLTAAGGATLAQWDAALEAVTFLTTDTNAGSSRTVAWQISDGGASSGQATSTVNVDSGPQVAAGGNVTATFTGGGGAVVLDSSVSLSDQASQTLTGATVTILGAQSGDTLNLSPQNDGISILSNSSGVLTLTGQATVAQYQAALDSITYSFNPTDGDPTSGGATRTINWVVSDSLVTSSPATSSIDTVHVAPTVTAGTTTTYVTGGAPAVLDQGLMLNDVDSGGDLTSATVSVVSPAAGDTLMIDGASSGTGMISGQNGTISYSFSGSTLTLSGSDTIADYQTALSSITFSTTSASTTARTIDWTVSDGASTNNTSTLATSTVQVIQGPQVTAGATATFTPGGGVVALDPGLMLSDPASTTLSGATVEIGTGFVSGSDVLNFTNQSNITGTYANGVLTLSGTDTLANYQTALESITFSTTSASTTPRMIDWAISDGVHTSAAVTSTVEETAGTAATALVVTTSNSTVTFDQGGAAVTVDQPGAGITITDSSNPADLVGATVTVSNFQSGDVLGINGSINGTIAGTSITESYSTSTGILTLMGQDTIADYQTALSEVTFSSTAAPLSTVPRTITFTVNDGTVTGGATDTVAIHDQPAVTAGASVTFDGGGAPVALDPGLTLSDPSGTTLSGATVSIASPLAGDTLMIDGVTSGMGTLQGGTIQYAFSTGPNGSETLTLSGNDTVADYQAALRSVEYSFTPSNGDPTSGGTDPSRVISWTVTDVPLTSGDAALTSATATSTLDTVHVAPTLQAAASATFTGGGAAVTLDSGITLNDIDSGDTLTGATVSISNGYLSGDTLNFNPTGNGISIASNSGGVLVLTGTATFAQYQAALDSITYSFTPSNGDPTGGGGDTSRTINWTVTDASSSNETSAPATSTLDVVHVAPTLTTAGTVTYVQGGSAQPLDSSLTLTDPDSGGLLTGATVQISSGFLAGDTLSAITTGLPSITASYDSATGTLTLSGSDTLADYEHVLESVTFSSTSANPTNNGTDPSRTITWTINDGVSTNPAIETSTVDVHALPVVTAGATATFTGGGTAVALDPGLTVTDTSSATLSSATVSIASPVSGDTLSFTNNGTNEGDITVSNLSTSSNLVLTSASGATLAEWDAALEAVTYSFTTGGDPTNGGTDTARTINWTVSDGIANSAAATSSLGTVHVAPTVSASGTSTFDGGGVPVVLDGTIGVADVDSGGTLTSATVSIVGAISGDMLTINNSTQGTFDNGKISYTFAGSTLSLTGIDTTTEYQAALQSITYSFTADGDPTAGGGHTSRTIDWSVTDNVSTSAIAATTLDTVHVAPTVTAGTPVGYAVGSSSPVQLDSMLDVTDLDSGGTLTGATVSIGAGFSTGDTLSFTAQAGITGTYDAATGVLTLSTAPNSPVSIAEFQTALESITFATTSTVIASRTIDWTATDGSTTNGTSAVATSTVEVSVPPTVTAGATATFTGGGAAVALDPGFTITAGTSSTLASATVAIAGGISGDTLSFSNIGNGTEGNIAIDTVNSSASRLVLVSANDTATVAQWQAALESITYSFNPANGDPTQGGDTTRTINWSVNDGALNSATVTSMLDTVHVAPSIVTDATAPVNYGLGGPAVALDGALAASDVDSSGTLLSATVTIGTGFVSGDMLNFTGIPSDITGLYDPTTGKLTLTAQNSAVTVSDFNAALDSITFSTSATTPGSRTIDWTATDGATTNNTSAVETSTINVIQGPQVSAGFTQTFTGGGGAVALDPGLTITDPSKGTLASATVTIEGGVSGDALNFTSNGTEGNITASGDGTGQLTLTSSGGTATLAQWQAALESVTFSTNPSDSDPTGGGSASLTRTIDWVVNDGVVTSGTATSTLDTVHVAPTVTPSGVTATFDGGGSPVALDNNIAVNDVDSDGDLTGATVTITDAGAAVTGDTLTIATADPTTGLIAGTNITAQYNSTTDMLTLTGSDTLAHYQAALQSITYSFTPGGDPTLGGIDTTRTITWTVSDANIVNGSSTVATNSLNVVHEPPAVVAGANVAFEIGGSTSTILDPTATVNDPDSGGYLSEATISISNGFVSGDSLNFNNGNPETFSSGTISGVFNGTVLTLSGSASVSDYQTALDSITFDTTSGSYGTRTISWQIKDSSTSNGSSAIATSTVNVETGPQITAGATETFTGGGAPAALDPSLTIADQSNPDLYSASVTISSGYISGDILSANTTGTNITALYTNGVLNLSGQDSVAHYQQVLDSVSYSFSPSNADPTNGGGAVTRTITWGANDGAPNLVAATSTLDVVHAPPVVATGTPAVSFQGGGTPVLLDSGLTLTDVDSSGNLIGATVTIGNGNLGGDVLSFNNTSNSETFADGKTITAVFSGATLTLSGTASVGDYQTALQQVQFGFSGNGDPTNGGGDTARTISWQVMDGNTQGTNGTSTTVTTTLNVVHTPPTVTAGDPAVAFDGGGATVLLDQSLNLSDVDSAGTLTGATISIGSGFIFGDTLSVGTSGGLTVAYDSATGVLSLSGTASVATYQAALDSVSFSFLPANGDPTNGGGDTSRTILWRVSDGSTSNGTSVSASTTLNVVHVAPVVTAEGSVTFNGGGSPVTLDGGLTIIDPDSADVLTGATVSIGNFSAGDVLNFTNQNGITGSYNAATGVLTLSGSSSLAHYQAALDSVTYNSTSYDPTNGGGTTSRTVNWIVTDGVKSSTVATTRIETSPILAPPPLGSQFTAPYATSAEQGPLGESFPMITDLQTSGGFNALPSSASFSLSNGNGVHTGHAELDVTLTADGQITVDLPLAAVEAPLGDVVSITASLADGKPLPPWLHFDSADGKLAFAGQIPDEFVTASIGHGGDLGAADIGKPGMPQPTASIVPNIELQIVARDTAGNIAIFNVTLKLTLPPHAEGRGHHHGGPHFEVLATTALPSDVRLAGLDMPGHDIAAFDLAHHIAKSHPGRAGLSTQLDTLGWRGMHGHRAALLESLQHLSMSGL